MRKPVTLFSGISFTPWGTVAVQLAAGRHPTKHELVEALESGTIPLDIDSKVRELIVEVIGGRYPRGLKPLSFYTDTTTEQGRLNWIGALVYHLHKLYGRGTLDAIYKEVAQDFEDFDMTERNVKARYLRYKNGD